MPPKPLVVAIPVGPEPVVRHLGGLQQAGHFLKDRPLQVLLMGLCGSLSPTHAVGDVVIYQDCVYDSHGSSWFLSGGDRISVATRSTDPGLTTSLYHKLKEKATLVRSLTSDRLIFAASEKRHLGQVYNAQVVDMEGFAALEVLNQMGVTVAMVRVVSDDSHHNLPNLTSAIGSDGSLQPWLLSLGMIRQPIAATRLIRGAIQGLRVLQQVTTEVGSRGIW